MGATKSNETTRIAARKCVNFQFRRIARSLSQLYDAALRPTGLRGTQFTMLVVIEATQPVLMSDLADHLVMDRSTLTRNFQRLDELRLVSSKVGKDRRSRLVRLTRQGESALTQALPYWWKAQRQVLDGIGGGALQAVVDAIHKLGLSDSR